MYQDQSKSMGEDFQNFQSNVLLLSENYPVQHTILRGPTCLSHDNPTDRNFVAFRTD